MLTLVLAEARSPASPALDHSVVLRRLRFSPGHPEAGGVLLFGGVLPRVLTSADPSRVLQYPCALQGFGPNGQPISRHISEVLPAQVKSTQSKPPPC